MYIHSHKIEVQIRIYTGQNGTLKIQK